MLRAGHFGWTINSLLIVYYYCLQEISLLTLLYRVVMETLVRHFDPKQSIQAQRAWPGHAQTCQVCILAMTTPEEIEDTKISNFAT